MLKATRRRVGASAWLALGLVVGLPAMAQAQLFPNRTITRQRTACAAEPPFNAHVRRDYFGYYPTCWTRFPEGWECPCPNPEKPNAAAAFAKQKRDDLPTRKPTDIDPMDDPDAAGGMGRDPAPADPGLPPLPNTRQPFDLEPSPDRPANPDPSLPPARTPGATRPANPPSANPPAGRTGPGPGASLMEMPSLPVASIPSQSHLDPGSMAMAPEATLASTGLARPDLGSLPDAVIPAASTPGPAPTTVDATVVGAPVPAAVPAQAPRRRGLLGGLFGSGNTRRR